MTRPLQIPGAFRRRLLHQDRSTARWLDAAPEHAAGLCRRWGLEADGDPRFGGTSIVLPVRTDSGEPAALKLVSPLADASLEATALTALAGHGVVDLLRADGDEGALLLERLAARTLIEHPDPVEAARIAGEVAGRIAAVPAPPLTPRLAETSRSWGEAFQAQHVRAVAAGLPIPSGAGERTAEIIDDLAEDSSTTLTHADLSLENVLRRTDGEWVAIDPGSLCGPVEFEAHTVVRSVLGAVLEAPRPREAIRAVVDAFCDAAGADPDRAETISFARFVASWFWESQHSGRADDIQRLLRVIELTVDESD
ncbi:aminoglycoside phosphotransferase family protein [Brachybacterium sp. AOP43-C2-M15]|uniref:aminoglycoside phosphotransferase family protein n=1 Tax=Brachybacterium sp. AOP43-C2-M15 TaxID=3457661 RepID=UPI004033535D